MLTGMIASYWCKKPPERVERSSKGMTAGLMKSLRTCASSRQITGKKTRRIETVESLLVSEAKTHFKTLRFCSHKVFGQLDPVGKSNLGTYTST